METEPMLNRVIEWVKTNYEVVPIKDEWITKTGTWDWDKVDKNWTEFKTIYDHYIHDGNRETSNTFSKLLNKISKTGNKGLLSRRTATVRVGIKQFDRTKET